MAKNGLDVITGLFTLDTVGHILYDVVKEYVPESQRKELIHKFIEKFTSEFKDALIQGHVVKFAELFSIQMRKTKIASNLGGEKKTQAAPRWLFTLNKGLRSLVKLESVMKTHHRHRSQRKQVMWNFGSRSWVYKAVD